MCGQYQPGTRSTYLFEKWFSDRINRDHSKEKCAMGCGRFCLPDRPFCKPCSELADIL